MIATDTLPSCDHCGKRLLEHEGTYYEQGLLCDECPDQPLDVFVVSTSTVRICEKTMGDCCNMLLAWFSDELEEPVTITQEAMTVGEYYSLPEFQG